MYIKINEEYFRIKNNSIKQFLCNMINIKQLKKSLILILIIDNIQISQEMLKLATIANNIVKQGRSMANTVVGVVVDVTRPLFREKQNNYIVMIKVVDQSLNDQQLFGVMSKDCTVYLISKNKQQIDFIKAVGSIVILDKFMFTLWNGIKLQTKYLSATEGLYIVQGIAENGEEFIFDGQLSRLPELLDINSIIIERVKNLMQWRSTKLPLIYEPKIGINILNSHCVMVQPFNMILRFQGVLNQEQHIGNSAKQIQYMLILKDLNDNSYLLKYVTNKNNDLFEVGDILFIRGIQSIGPSLELNLTLPGNVLKFAYKVDPTVMNYIAIHRDNEKFTADRTENQFTVISCDNNEITYISDLMQLQDKYNHSNKKQEIQVRDTYFVKAVVINYSGYLSFYHKVYQILLHNQFYGELSYEEKKEYKENNRIGYVYEGVLALIDRSNQSKSKPFYVNLFTSDPVGNFMPAQQIEKAQKYIGDQQQNKQNTARKQLLTSINKKLQKISAQSTFARPVSLALQPIKSQKLLFRVANTKIL